MNSPSLKGSRPRRLAAVWFADIVGFTRLSAKDEPMALRLVQAFQTAACLATEAHGGSVVKFMGDGVLAAFTSVKGASSAAIQLQLSFRQVTRGWAGQLKGTTWSGNSPLSCIILGTGEFCWAQS